MNIAWICSLSLVLWEVVVSNLVFNFRRTLRRIGIALLLVGILATSAIGWVLECAHDLVHFCVKALGLSRVEDWLRRRSVWFAFVLVFLMTVVFLIFKKYELGLILHKHILLALSYGLIFKIVWMSIMNYLLHLFGDQLLGVRVIAWGHGHYVRAKTFALEYLRQSAIYRRASAIKRRVMILLRRRSLLRIAKRLDRTKKRDEKT